MGTGCHRTTLKKGKTSRVADNLGVGKISMPVLFGAKTFSVA